MPKKIKPIYETNNPKHYDKSITTAWLMSEEGKDHAIRLQLDNLVLTYGIDAIKEVLQKTSLDVIQQAKRKVA
ncbi:MAG: hypothetical protein COB41_00185 [Proteobacteria bacterium]|nr:MAG: hypothetical protein COB41_00185 [Pseudomonadota bacterium]